MLYFDEPTSGLDYDSMIRVSELIKELSGGGAIIFLVSHDFEFITHTCTRMFDLDAEKMLDVNKGNLQMLAKKYFA